MHIGYRRDGSSLLVVVQKLAAGQFAVTTDGVEHAVAVIGIDDSTVQLVIDGAIETAHVVRVGTAMHVWLAGEVYALAPESGTAAATAHAALAPPQIVAPMPGKVLQVLVAVGQEVAEGDGLVIVEAMKMEHRIAAAAAATVRAVHVADGQMVDGGAVLVELDYA